jgi:hypothetical protein
VTADLAAIRQIHRLTSHDPTCLDSIAGVSPGVSDASGRSQEHEVLVRGLVHVGMIAMVDEATGHQDAPARDALAQQSLE